MPHRATLPRLPLNLAAALLAAFLCLMLALPALAQDATAPADQPAPEEPASAGADAPPALPAAVTDPSLATDELTLRLIPLTEPELAQAASEWQALAKAKTAELIDLQIEIANAGDAATEAMRTRLDTLTAERKDIFDKYSAVLDGWAKKGGDPAAIDAYRAYRSGVLIEEAQSTDYRTLLAQGARWTTSPDGGIRLAIRVGVVIAALIALFAVARIVRAFAARWIGRIPNLSKLLQAFLAVLVYWLTLAIGLMVVLSALGVDITPVFALIGGASFIMAFALQDTLGNLASGLMIMVNRPFDEGDYVDIGGVAGTVKSVSIVSTKVTTPDNQVIVVPNSKVWGNVITNVTTSETRRVDLVFGISYADSIATALEVIDRVVKAHPLILAFPEPVIRVHELADSSVNIVCRPWVKGSDYWAVYWDLTRQVKEAFDSAGISIPFPQLDVHFRPVDGSGGLLAQNTAPPAASKSSLSVSQAQGDEGYDADDDR